MATYGIDLGTTYSCIAYVDETGRPVVLKSAVGEDTTPSVVYFESASSVLVGTAAKDAATVDPDNAVALIKRRMGTEFELIFQNAREARLDDLPEHVLSLMPR